MKHEPLAWNTLTEAAAWLSSITGEEWTPRRVLDAALSFPVGQNPPGASNLKTAIHAAMKPKNKIKHGVLKPWKDSDPNHDKPLYLPLHEISYHPMPLLMMGLNALNSEHRAAQFVHHYDVANRTVGLLQSEVREVMAQRLVKLEVMHDLTNYGPEIQIIVPPLIASDENLGIPRDALLALANALRENAPDTQPKTAAPGPKTPKWEIPGTWEHKAREMAKDMLKENPKLGVEKLARHLADKSDFDYSWETIKRHALRGITGRKPTGH